MTIEGKRILVTGGTGSLGQRVVKRLLQVGELGRPARITVLSRDEAKQHDMRLRFLQKPAATDDVIYQHARDLLAFRIGDVRDYDTMVEAVRNADIVIHAAALKQVPTCEYFPLEAIRTNVLGADALVRATMAAGANVETVVGISTDKACKPINVMGMTKAVMERVFVEANLRQPATRFVGVRYGNVVASRGSVVPLFLEQIAKGGPVTITLKEMTRFLLTLDRAVDTVLAALTTARAGEIYVPKVPAARMVDLAEVLIGGPRHPDRVYGHPARREGPRDHGLGRGVPPHHRARRLLRDLSDAAGAVTRVGRRRGADQRVFVRRHHARPRRPASAARPYLTAALPAELNA